MKTPSKGWVSFGNSAFVARTFNRLGARAIRGEMRSAQTDSQAGAFRELRSHSCQVMLPIAGLESAVV
jgi:hypothetical protein